VSSLAADFIDVGVLFVREAHPAVVAIGTALLVIALTVVLLPGVVQAMLIGYWWTYAYGGTIGVLFGTLTYFVGTFAAAAITYHLGRTAAIKACVGKVKTWSVLAHFDDTPMILAILVRACPLVPFNLANYYMGACGRFGYRHVAASHIATLPEAFLWTGVGGAILKFRLVDRGETDRERYMPFVWAGFSVTIVVLLFQVIFVCFYVRRTVKRDSSSGGAATSSVDIQLKKTRTYSQVQAPNIEEGGAPPPPPPGPPPLGSSLQLQVGWREIASDDGETYYFNDDTGESQWDPPLAGGPPPPSQPASMYPTASVERMAE